MKILLLAGEESGMIYADALRRELESRHEIRGYADWGFKVSDMAVMGFVPVLLKARYFLRLKRTMMRAIDEWRPDVVVTVDYPGMNLRLAAYAKKRGIRAVHIVSPQVWAWKAGRIPKIEAAVSRLLCFFPFEPGLYSPNFATFVGHPLAEKMAEARAAFGGRREKGLVAILPGSRIGEIERNLPVMLDAAMKLEGVRVEMPAASADARRAMEKVLARRAPALGARILDGGARELLLRADVAAVASGTATLEAALAHCPTVLVYRVGWLFAFLARRLIKGVKHIGLANIVWEKSGEGGGEPMPELLQEAFTAPALAAVLARWLGDEAARNEAAMRLERISLALATDGRAVERMAKEVEGWTRQ